MTRAISQTIRRVIAGGISGAIATCSLSTTVQAENLTDITDHWAERCINYLDQQGIVQGYPDQTFRPNQPVTRTEFAAFINRAFPEKAEQVFAREYDDLDETYWGLTPIDRATRTGFLTGYPDGTFQPTRNIPRYEILLALVSGLNYSPYGDPQSTVFRYYTDANELPEFAYGAIAAATEQELVVNYPDPNRLNPQQWASRAEVASSLCRALNITGTIPAQYIVTPSNPANNQGQPPRGFQTSPTFSP